MPRRRTRLQALCPITVDGGGGEEGGAANGFTTNPAEEGASEAEEKKRRPRELQARTPTNQQRR